MGVGVRGGWFRPRLAPESRGEERGGAHDRGGSMHLRPDGEWG